MTAATAMGWTLSVAGLLVLAGWLLVPRAADGEAGRPSTAPSARTAAAREFWDTYKEASARRMDGDCASALDGYRAALALRPHHEDSLYYLGNCLLDLRRYDESIAAYRQLAALNPDGSARAYVQWGLVHASLHPDAPFDLDEADRLFQRAADLEPDSGAHLGLAEVAVLRGDEARAQRLLTPIVAESPMHVPAPYLLGYLHWRAGTIDDAWRHFAMAFDRLTAGMPASRWSEEGDARSAPALRWRALARQSVFGAQWLALRSRAVGRAHGQQLAPQLAPTRADLEHAYVALDAVVAATRARRPGQRLPRATAGRARVAPRTRLPARAAAISARVVVSR